MRPSLLPGLIAAARRNLDRGASSRPPVRDRPALSRRCRACRRSALLLAGETHRARLAVRQGAGRSTRSMPRPRRWRCSRRPGAPVDNLQVFPDAGPTWHPGRSATLRLGPKTIVASVRRASPAAPEEPRRAGRRGRRGNLSRRDPGAARRRPCPPGLSPRPRCRRSRATSPSSFPPTCRPTLCSARSAARDKAAITGGPPVRPLRDARTACRSPSKSRCSRPRRASPTSRSARFRSASSPPPRS